MTQASQLDVLTSVIYQFEYHWKEQIRPRLEGLTDAEYLYDPSADRSAWTVHPADERRTEMQAGARDTVVDFAFPEPDPAPFTTIGWRLAHVIVGVLAVRSHAHRAAPRPPTRAGTTPPRPRAPWSSWTPRSPAGSTASGSSTMPASPSPADPTRALGESFRCSTSSCTSTAS